MTKDFDKQQLSADRFRTRPVRCGYIISTDKDFQRTHLTRGADEHHGTPGGKHIPDFQETSANGRVYVLAPHHCRKACLIFGKGMMHATEILIPNSCADSSSLTDKAPCKRIKDPA